MPVKISKSKQNEINKVIRNFNQKIRRLEKLDQYNLLYIPNKASKRELISEVSNTRELTQKLKELKAYTHRGAEKTVTTKKGEEFSKWELDIYKKERQKALRNINQKIKKMETTKVRASGKNLEVTFAQMGDPTFISAIRNKQKILREKEPTRSKYRENIKYFRNQREYQNHVLKSNYLQGLKNMGYQSGIPKEIIENIYNNFMKLNDKDFLNMYNNDLSVSKIMNYYRVFAKALSSGKMIDSETVSDITELFYELNDNLEQILSNK
ncbi:MAG: hypothetical protein OSJ63_05535 [Bacilli bacterium]|nr:hypothetical protein [Bacilli bacterium]